MDYDVDLMRELLLDLELRQTVPPSTIVISLDAEAMAHECHVSEVEAGLEGLRDLAYIDGSGADTPGFFGFRALTDKGSQFVETMRRPRDWAALKRHFEARRDQRDT